MIKKLLFLLFFIVAVFANSFKVSYDPDYAPFSYTIDNKPYGLLVDIWKEWARVNNYKLIFIKGKDWENAIELAKNSKVDFFIGTEPYEKWMKKGVKIYQVSTSFFTLKGKKDFSVIGIIGDDYEEFLKKKFSKSKIISFKNYDELVQALITKKVSIIYDDSIAVNYFIIRKRLNHLIEKIKLFSVKSSIYPISNSEKNIVIFNNGFDKISLKTLKKIETSWILNLDERIYSNINKIYLNQKEEEWLKHNPLVKIAIMSYWKSDNSGNNLHTEILKLISKYSGLDFVPVRFNKWKDGYEEVKSGKNIYGIMGLSYSKEREKYFYYTSPYSFDVAYLIVKKENSNISSLKDVKKIYLKSKNISEKILRKENQSADILYLDSQDEMYKNLRNNQSVDSILTFFLDKNKLEKYNLKVVQKIYSRYGETAIGINKNYPELYSIINKAFQLIPKSELVSLRDKNWEEKKVNKTGIENKIDIDLFDVLSIEEIIFAFILFVVMGFVLYKNYSDSTFLDINIKIFAKFIIIFEFFIGFFMIYEVIIFDRLENKILELQQEKFKIFELINNIRHSSDDLSKFARCYAVTGNRVCRENYFKTLDIRNGKIGRPKFYEFIYWDLLKELREKRHPFQEKISFNDIVKKSSLRKNEKSLLEESHNESDDLVNLEVIAFKLVKMNQNDKAMKLLYSKEYYKAKEKIMNPIDKLYLLVRNRTESSIKKLDYRIKIQFRFIMFLSIFFILGNVLIYLMIRKKIIEPISYIYSVINKIKNEAKIPAQKSFYRDEIGEVIKEFFVMQNELEKRILKAEELHKQREDSIKYSSLIQHSILPDNSILKQYFEDYFVVWNPKDTVGGDIYLIEEVSNGILIMCIDCTGHGVSGAFVTMLVKSIEREIVSKINTLNEEPSPSKILSIFNKSIKGLLKQDNKSSVSNSGFDGAVLFYNKKENYIKYSGANSPLFYIENGKINTIKGDRYSVGYKNSESSYNYKEYLIKTKDNMRFYLSTDGYIDQNGGKKGFPFGKKRFIKIIESNYYKKMSDQQEVLMKEFLKYKGDEEINDDNLVIGFKI